MRWSTLLLSRMPTGDLQPEHCTSLNFVPEISISSISNVVRLQWGQLDMYLSYDGWKVVPAQSNLAQTTEYVQLLIITL